VTLRAPHTHDRQPLRLWAVYLEEKKSSADATALRWLLLTTAQVASRNKRSSASTGIAGAGGSRNGTA